MTTLLIAATEESTGKTAVALALARIVRDRGGSVGYMKPKGTHLESVGGKSRYTDAMFARDLLDLDASIDDLQPIAYSPTFIENAVRGNEDPATLKAMVRDRFDAIAAGSDYVIVEGGGSYMAGGVIELTDDALAELVDAPILLVATYHSPSDLDNVLAAAHTMAPRLDSVVFNAVPDGLIDQVQTNVRSFLESHDIPVSGVLPRVPELAGVAVGDFAEALGASVVTSVPTDGYVDRIVVGAMGADAALRYFRRTRNAVVITGGDRSDIHTVAVEAPSVNCLCLTGGYQPSSAVLGKAQSRGLPVLTVSDDTLTTIERAEEILRSGRVRDETAVNRMQALLESHVDLEGLLGPID